MNKRRNLVVAEVGLIGHSPQTLSLFL